MRLYEGVMKAALEISLQLAIFITIASEVNAVFLKDLGCSSDIIGMPFELIGTVVQARFQLVQYNSSDCAMKCVGRFNKEKFRDPVTVFLGIAIFRSDANMYSLECRCGKTKPTLTNISTCAHLCQENMISEWWCGGTQNFTMRVFLVDTTVEDKVDNYTKDDPPHEEGGLYLSKAPLAGISGGLGLLVIVVVVVALLDRRRAGRKSSVGGSGSMDNPKSRISTTTSVTEAPGELPAYAQPIPKKDRASSKAARTTPENSEDSSLAKKFAEEDKWRHSDVTAFSDDAVFVDNNAYSKFPVSPQ